MNNLIDLESYPLDRLDSADGQALVTKCIADLEARGMFTLEGFMRREVIDDILPGLLHKLGRESFTHAREHNIYFDDSVAGLPADHPRNILLEARYRMAGPLMQIYQWPALAGFLARVMGKPALYPMADPLACANVMGYYEGEGLNWHFDRSEFTTTLLLQAPRQGGDFQYRHALRSAADPNYDGVARLLTLYAQTPLLPDPGGPASS